MFRKKKTEALREARSKMTKKEREEEEKKQEQAMTRFADQAPLPAQAENVLEKAKKKTKARQKIEPDPAALLHRKTSIIENVLGSLKVEEDSDQWEQQMQAGCTFWRHVGTREIRLAPPKLKTGLPERKDARYALGTGSTLFAAAEYKKERLWLVARGMALPAIKFGRPTAEEIEERQKNAAARNIQRAAKLRAEERRKEQAKKATSVPPTPVLPTVAEKPNQEVSEVKKELVLPTMAEKPKHKVTEEKKEVVKQEEEDYEDDEYGDDYEDDEA